MRVVTGPVQVPLESRPSLPRRWMQCTRRCQNVAVAEDACIQRRRTAPGGICLPPFRSSSALLTIPALCLSKEPRPWDDSWRGKQCHFQGAVQPGCPAAAFFSVRGGGDLKNEQRRSEPGQILVQKRAAGPANDTGMWGLLHRLALSFHCPRINQHEWLGLWLAGSQPGSCNSPQPAGLYECTAMAGAAPHPTWPHPSGDS